MRQVVDSGYWFERLTIAWEIWTNDSEAVHQKRSDRMPTSMCLRIAVQ